MVWYERVENVMNNVESILKNARAYAVLCMLVILWMPSTGCSGNPSDVLQQTDAADTKVSDPHTVPSYATSRDEDAQRTFERAMEAYQARHADVALDRFRSFVESYPNDDLIGAATIWLARSYWMNDQAATGLRVLDEHVRQHRGQSSALAAQAWSAFLLQATEEQDRARQRVQGVIGQAPDFHVVEGMGPPEDVPFIAALFADNRIKTREFIPALRDLEVVERTSEDESMRGWAMTAALTVASEALTSEQLAELVEHGSTFQQAIAVRAYVGAMLDAHLLDDAQAAFQHAAPSMLRFGMEQGYAALQNTLTLRGELARPMFGVAISLSGADRFAGDAALRGMMMAQRSYESRTRSVDAWIEDTRGNRAGAKEAVQRLCEKKVPVIIGPLEQALVPIVREGATACGALYVGLETFGTSATSTVRMSLDAREEARALVGYLDTQQASSVVIVSESPRAGYFQELVEEARERATARNIRVLDVVDVESANLQKSSAQTAKRIRQLNPRAILFAVSDTTMTALSSYLAAENIWPRAGERGNGPDYVASSFAVTPTLMLNSSDYIQQMVIASWTEQSNPRYGAFLANYEQVFGGQPGMMTAFAFDAANFARAMVLERGLHRGDQIRTQLEKGVRFMGATGVWEWQNGQQHHAPALLRVLHGEAGSL